jgi:hypothetical protein
VFSTEARTLFLLAEGFVSCAIDSDDKNKKGSIKYFAFISVFLVKVLFDIGF